MITGSVPTLPFRHDTDAELLRDPFGTWDRLRNEHPIFKSDQADHGVIFLMGYAQQHAAFHDSATFSNRSVSADFRSDSDAGALISVEGFKLIPVQLDPPEHTKYRLLMNPLMTPGVVKALEPRARALCNSLIDEFVDDGRVDFMAKFSRRFPTTIFMELMGLPVENADTFLRWINELMHSSSNMDLTPDERVTTAQSAAQSIFSAYLGELIVERRQRPQSDFVSYLLTCVIDGRPLNENELMQICFMLYLAGLDTVAGALGYFFQHLAMHPDDRRRIVADPSLIPSAVEELLRVYAVVNTVREVVSDTEFMGCPMHKGDRVVFPTASANRDPSEFPDADVFDMERQPNRHMAFGVGPHRCLGSHLARLELRLALEEWHRRIPDYHIEDPSALKHHVLSVTGLESLPLVFDG